MLNKKELTVIIPFYKKMDTFYKTFLSLKNQSYKNFKTIIVYDDEQKKDLVKIKKIISNDKNFQIIINKKNIGAGYSRNKALKKADTKYVAFLDADDVWHKDKLKFQINLMKKKKFLMTFTSYNIIDDKNKIIGKIPSKNNLNYKEILKSCDIGLSTVMLNTQIIKNLKFGKTKTKEDYILWLKLAKKTNFIGINKTLSSWRKSNNSLSSNILQKVIDAFKVYFIYEKYNFFISIIYTIRLSLNFLLKHYLNLNIRI